jgi:hypothetical protein
MTPKPVDPCSPDRRRQYELIEEIAQLLAVHVEADVVLGPLAEHLLVNPCTVGTGVEVIGDRRAAPTDVQGKLDPAARLRTDRSSRSSGTATGRAAGPRSGPGRRPLTGAHAHDRGPPVH